MTIEQPGSIHYVVILQRNIRLSTVARGVISQKVGGTTSLSVPPWSKVGGTRLPRSPWLLRLCAEVNYSRRITGKNNGAASVRTIEGLAQTVFPVVTVHFSYGSFILGSFFLRS